MPGNSPSVSRRRATYGVAGKTVLITGPARGIGAETARHLARKGANLGLAGLEPERLAVLAEEIGPNAAWFEADVRDLNQLERAVAGTVDRFGGIDVVIANAGQVVVGTTGSTHPADFERVVDVNLLGTWRTVRAVLPYVLDRDGYVLFVASLAAIVPEGRHAAYAASKAGVSSLADSLRMELAGSGTRVGCAYFGLVDTDMAAPRRSGPPAAEAVRRPRMPASRAAEAIVSAIEGRARWIVLPRKLRPALYAPVVVRRLAESRAGRRNASRRRDADH